MGLQPHAVRRFLRYGVWFAAAARVAAGVVLLGISAYWLFPEDDDGARPGLVLAALGIIGAFLMLGWGLGLNLLASFARRG